MALYKDPITAIFDAADAQNGVALVREHYVLGEPVAFADPEGLVNTKISITANSALSAYEGTQDLYYTRLNLADLLRFLPSPILGYNLTTTAHVAQLLNTYYGLNFIDGDLEVAPLSLVNGVGVVTLTALPLSKGWMGTVQLPVALGNIPIDSAIIHKTIDGVLYPNRDETKPFGEMETYWRDFSSHDATLAAISITEPDLAAVATVLTAVTKNNWLSNASGRYSLQGATVLYNDDTIGYPRSNQTRGYVLVIRLGAGSLGLSGDLFLHYGFYPPIP